jgi:hypothetical protein
VTIRNSVGGLIVLSLVLGGTGAHAGTITVNATDVIYLAGSGSAPSQETLPGFINLSGAASVTFSSVMGSRACASPEGCITLNGSGNLNDPDGAGAAPTTSSNTGAGSISGMKGPGAGYLTGVFVAAGGPSGAAPASLDFTTGSGTSFTSLSPLLDQVFFIGDGLTGDNTGSVQIFNVPSGAVALYLGISDACGYNGRPGCYSDNSGTYTVTYALVGFTCGDGTIDPGEQCDDGALNGTPQSCCTTSCQFTPAGSDCDDSNPCTQTDQCDGSGNCVGSTFDPIGAILADPSNLSSDQQAIQCLIFELEHGQVPAVP